MAGGFLLLLLILLYEPMLVGIREAGYITDAMARFAQAAAPLCLVLAITIVAVLEFIGKPRADYWPAVFAMLRNRLSRGATSEVGDALASILVRHDFDRERLDEAGALAFVNRTMLLPEFVDTLVREQASVAAGLILVDDYVARWSSERLIETAFRNGVLAAELRTLPYGAGKRLSAEDFCDAPLLKALFADPHVAEVLHAWKPVGEGILRELDRRRHSDEFDYDNLPIERQQDFEERDRWDSLLGVAEVYFDLMLEQAMVAGVKWHMWVYYMPHIFKRIERNLNLSECDPGEECPNVYLYLEYRMMSTLAGLARNAQYLPDGSPHARPVAPNGEHDNSHIPKSALITYARCLEHVITSSVYPERFKLLRAESAVSLWEDLRKYKCPAGLRQAYEVLLLEPAAPKYRSTLRRVIADSRRDFTFPEHHDELTHAVATAWG